MTALPRLECDLVLEGAVTSAVVYLGFAARLSRRYRFRCLAGTSSGAAVAAAAAVAEAARARSDDVDSTSFCRLLHFADQLSEVVDGKTRLLRLFQPADVLHWPFRLLVAFFASRSRPKRRPSTEWNSADLAKVFAVVFAVLAAFVAAVGLLLPSWLMVWHAAPVLLVLPLLALTALVVATLRHMARAFVSQHFGLCTGMPEGDPPRDERALTPVLNGLFNELWGRTPVDEPVVFADLWKAWPESAEQPGRAIDLQIVTTVLQQQLSLHLPGPPGVDPLRDYFYDVQEWSRLFPPSVMRWLERHARSVGPVHATGGSGGGRMLRALPAPDQLPVIVAVRLSVGFPGLLSAIPMYTLAQGHGLQQPAHGQPARFEAVKVYFTDGGITSNLPVQVFDAPLPGRPTFAVNLFRFDKNDPTDKDGGIFFGARRNEPETRPRSLPEPHRWLASIAGFIGEIVTTAMDWRDTVLRTLPGCRERVLHVGLTPEQGSLNLAMSRDQILGLMNLGCRAARRVVDDFSLPHKPGQASRWEEHRWLRLRSLLAAAQVHARALAMAAAKSHVHGEPSYRALLRNPRPAGPAFVDDEARRQAEDLLDALAAAGRGSRPGEGLEAHLPEPAPVLRLGPP